jgi:hypothetical protein
MFLSDATWRSSGVFTDAGFYDVGSGLVFSDVLHSFFTYHDFLTITSSNHIISRDTHTCVWYDHNGV